MLSKYLSPRNDLSFKRIFNEDRNKDILIHFLNDLLPIDRPIRAINFLKTIQIPEIAALRTSIVDAICEDENGEKFIVEMQVSHEKHFSKRCLYYAARTYCSQRIIDHEYQNLKNVYFLAITNFSPFPNKKDWFSHIGLKDMETNEHDIESIQLFFLQLPLFAKKKEDIEGMTIREKWAYFFKYAEETTEEDLEKIVGDDLIIKKAYDELNRFSWSRGELLEYDSVDMKLWADQGVKKAAEEKGIAKGIEKGIAKGRKEGYEEGRREIAKKLLQKGIMSINEIAEMTELDIKDVQALEQGRGANKT